MKVRARVGFSGLVSMSAGEVRDITDKAILNDLIGAGYIEAVKSSTGGAKNESKRVKAKRDM